MKRGDIYLVDMNPVSGREQAGRRFVLIVSPQAFNKLGTPLICPVTQGGNFARHAGFTVSLTGAGTETQGVVLCNQPRVLDMKARNGKFIERVPPAIVGEVLAKLQTLID